MVEMTQFDSELIGEHLMGPKEDVIEEMYANIREFEETFV